MRLTVYLDDGGVLNINQFNADTVLDLREELDSRPWLTFEMDEATVIVARDHITRIDIDTEGA